MAREYNPHSAQSNYYNDYYRGNHHEHHMHHGHQPSDYAYHAPSPLIQPNQLAYHPKPSYRGPATRRPALAPIQTHDQSQTGSTNNNQIIYAQDMKPYTYSLTPTPIQTPNTPQTALKKTNDTFYAQDIVQSPYSNGTYSLSTSSTATPRREIPPIIDNNNVPIPVNYPHTNVTHVQHEKNYAINASPVPQYIEPAPLPPAQNQQQHQHQRQSHCHIPAAPPPHPRNPSSHIHYHLYTSSNPYYHANNMDNNRNYNAIKDAQKHVSIQDEYKYEEPRIPVAVSSKTTTKVSRDYDVYSYQPIAAVNKDQQTLAKKDHHIFCGIQQADLYQTLWDHYHKNIELLLKVQSFIEEGGYYAANMKELRETMIIEQMMNKEQFQGFIENEYTNFINGQTLYINSIELKTPKNYQVQALTKGIERIVNLKSMTIRVINDIDKMLRRLDDSINDHANENEKITNYALQFTTKI